jgi:hypothetical protein
VALLGNVAGRSVVWSVVVLLMCVLVGGVGWGAHCLQPAAEGVCVCVCVCLGQYVVCWSYGVLAAAAQAAARVCGSTSCAADKALTKRMLQTQHFVSVCPSCHLLTWGVGSPAVWAPGVEQHRELQGL